MNIYWKFAQKPTEVVPPLSPHLCSFCSNEGFCRVLSSPVLFQTSRRAVFLFSFFLSFFLFVCFLLPFTSRLFYTILHIILIIIPHRCRNEHDAKKKLIERINETRGRSPYSEGPTAGLLDHPPQQGQIPPTYSLNVENRSSCASGTPSVVSEDSSSIYEDANEN